MNPLPPALLHQGHFPSFHLSSVYLSSVNNETPHLAFSRGTLPASSSSSSFSHYSTTVNSIFHYFFSKLWKPKRTLIQSIICIIVYGSGRVSGWMEGRPTDRPHSHPNPNTRTIHSRNNKRTHSLCSLSLWRPEAVKTKISHPNKLPSDANSQLLFDSTPPPPPPPSTPNKKQDSQIHADKGSFRPQ
jgi:hypothetical protein